MMIPVLQTVNSIGVQPMPSAVDMRRTIFAPGNEALFDYDFIRLAITSHLQTGGVTVVMGPRKDIINMLIDSLAVFLTHDERRQSRYAQDEGDLSYAPDLFLQGIVQVSRLVLEQEEEKKENEAKIPGGRGGGGGTREREKEKEKEKKKTFCT